MKSNALLGQRLGVRLGDHAAVADEDDVLDPKAPADRLDRGGHRRLVLDAALVDRDRHRAALRRADEAVVDLQLALLGVARVAERRQRARPSLDV